MYDGTLVGLFVGITDDFNVFLTIGVRLVGFIIILG